MFSLLGFEVHCAFPTGRGLNGRNTHRDAHMAIIISRTRATSRDLSHLLKNGGSSSLFFSASLSSSCVSLGIHSVDFYNEDRHACSQQAYDNERQRVLVVGRISVSVPIFATSIVVPITWVHSFRPPLVEVVPGQQLRLLVKL